MGTAEPKQFLEIAGVPMLLRSIRPFVQLEAVGEIVVPVPRGILDRPPPWLAEAAVGRVRLVSGGASRADSVRLGVKALSPSCAVVLVHDAARPFVEAATIEAVIEVVRTGVSAVAAVPVSDTLKKADERGAVIQTVDRRGLWRAQTPQGFPYDILNEVYDRVGDALSATDEATLIERAGYAVTIVRDSTRNFKITTTDDLALAGALAQ